METGKIKLSFGSSGSESTDTARTFKNKKNKKKPFFDEKVQLDLNCMWISSLINTYDLNKDKFYLELAEKFYIN